MESSNSTVEILMQPINNLNKESVVNLDENVEERNPQENKEEAKKDKPDTQITLQELQLEFMNIKTYFNWNDFFYTMILGLAPSVWDIATDFQLAEQLIKIGRMDIAGFCYIFIFGPGYYLLPFSMAQLAFNKICTPVSGKCFLVLLAFYFIFYLALTLAVLRYPSSAYYLALPVASFILLNKLLAVFLHGPQMKKISMVLSTAESSCEASCQLMLLFYLWFSGSIRSEICLCLTCSLCLLFIVVDCFSFLKTNIIYYIS